ncbi:MAG: sulfotransferase [Bacteroidota bacterium]
MDTFKGPLFIVGMPRSGTKLLRNLLNQHPEISIPSVETHFIPYLYHKLQYQFPIDTGKLANIYDELAETTFFEDMRKKGKHLDKYNLVTVASEATNWSDVFGFLLRHYGPKSSPNVIIGDKTPSYITKMRTLKQDIFPNAKFLHIIRDPRDCCLSAKKLWGKSPLLFASVWHESVQKARSDAAIFSKDYLEIQYEELLEHPEKVLKRTCAFIGIDYQSEMITLKKPAENYGDAKNAKQIVNSNKKKYRLGLSPSTIRRIEEVTFPSAKESGYLFEYATRHRPLLSITKVLLTLTSGYYAFRFHIREKGLKHGISYYLRLHNVTH